MAGNIKIELYNGELGNPQNKFITDCETQWIEFEKRERMGANQLLYIQALSTDLGGEAQAVWRYFMERDMPLPASHVDIDRAMEIDSRNEWKRYRHRLWLYQNTNPIQPHEPKEPNPPMEPEPTDSTEFFAAKTEHSQQSTSEYINKLEAFRSRPGEGVETIFGRFNEIAKVVKDGAYIPAVLGIKFQSHLPTHVVKMTMTPSFRDMIKQALVCLKFLK